jgi:hypothetical protein
MIRYYLGKCQNNIEKVLTSERFAREQFLFFQVVSVEFKFVQRIFRQ